MSWKETIKKDSPLSSDKPADYRGGRHVDVPASESYVEDAVNKALKMLDGIALELHRYVNEDMGVKQFSAGHGGGDLHEDRDKLLSPIKEGMTAFFEKVERVARKGM